MRILIVEDEPLIVSFLERGLRAEGYATDSAPDRDTALWALRRATPDLVLLDVMLRGSDGFDVLATIRAIDPQLPVIMLTALGDVSDRVRGLDLGATDYVVKPFAFAELAARVRAHLRTSAVGQQRADELRAGDLRLDLLLREASVNGRAVELSAREFALLAYLMRHSGQVLSREQILNGVWGYTHDPRSNVVDVYVGYLRRKLAELGCPDRIQTVRGLGYRLARRAA